ncbi:TPA: hypothetical protein R4Y85_003029, partial [Raoultella planticola]|nr:hypothetical protein [Raoultella planticola]
FAHCRFGMQDFSLLNDQPELTASCAIRAYGNHLFHYDNFPRQNEAKTARLKEQPKVEAAMDTQINGILHRWLAQQTENRGGENQA